MKKLLAILCVALQLNAANAFVQSKVASTASAASIAAAFNSNVTAGSLIAVGVYGYYPTADPINFTCADGTNTYQSARSQVNGTFNEKAYIIYAMNAAGGATTVTCTPSGGVPEMCLVIAEFSGAATSSALDQVNSGTGVTDNPTPGAITTTTNGQIVFGFTDLSGAVPTEAMGFTKITCASLNSFKSAAQYQIQTSAGSITASWTSSPAVWNALVASFKAAAVTYVSNPTVIVVGP